MAGSCLYFSAHIGIGGKASVRGQIPGRLLFKHSPSSEIGDCLLTGNSQRFVKELKFCSFQ